MSSTDHNGTLLLSCSAQYCSTLGCGTGFDGGADVVAEGGDDTEDLVGKDLPCWFMTQT